jgi:hypothetical protein
VEDIENSNALNFFDGLGRRLASGEKNLKLNYPILEKDFFKNCEDYYELICCISYEEFQEEKEINLQYYRDK